MGWPPSIGEPLPRAAAAHGVREKLAGYSLNAGHPSGGPKARGFARILGITIAEIDHLEAEIRAGVLEMPISAVRVRPPYGIHCEVRVPVHGVGARRDRVAEAVTAWELSDAEAVPRLLNAYIKG